MEFCEFNLIIYGAGPFWKRNDLPYFEKEKYNEKVHITPVCVYGNML